MYKYKLVIFDADGTLSPQRDGSCGPFTFELMPGVREKCVALRADGVKLAIATNQSRKRPRWEIIEQLAWLHRHLDTDHEGWSSAPQTRKPKPFLLEWAMRFCEVAPADTLFVGDRETDRHAAEAAGVDFRWAREFFRWGAQS